jgi:hypothetical protein
MLSPAEISGKPFGGTGKHPTFSDYSSLTLSLSLFNLIFILRAAHADD